MDQDSESGDESDMEDREFTVIVDEDARYILFSPVKFVEKLENNSPSHLLPLFTISMSVYFTLYTIQ